MDAVGGERIGERAHHRFLADQIVETRRAGICAPARDTGVAATGADAISSPSVGSEDSGAGVSIMSRKALAIRGGRLDKDPPWLVRAASFRT